jgi:hypothetical protein
LPIVVFRFKISYTKRKDLLTKTASPRPSCHKASSFPHCILSSCANGIIDSSSGLEAYISYPKFSGNSPCTNTHDTNNHIVPVHNLLRYSTEMGHLISLKLESLSDTRRPSSPPTTMATFPPVSIFSKSPKRSRPGPVTNLTILPYTQEEWKTVMEEIRKLYLKGNYKQCAARCKQILEGISAKDPVSSLEPYSLAAAHLF